MDIKGILLNCLEIFICVFMFLCMKNKGLIITVTVIIFFMAIDVSAQDGNDAIDTLVVDSIGVANKDFWPTATSIVGLNVGVWAFDRYVQKGDFAYISLNSVAENFKHGFIWDNDRMDTNMLLHPYHGNLFFNAARANGYNYWQSGLFAFGGSAMWELFMESEYPSTNDIISTPIGGMALGEVLYRSSDLILDDRSSGWQRFGREFAAFLVSPMRGISRVVNGEAWKRRATSGRQYRIPNVDVECSVGGRVMRLNDEIKSQSGGLVAEAYVEYGDKYDEGNKPYDYFMFRLGLNVQKSQPFLGQVNIKGRLFGKTLIDKSDTQVNWGLYQYLDFYDSDTISNSSSKIPYRFSVPASVGSGLMFQRQNVGSWCFEGHADATVMLLGAVLSDHYYLDERNYNMAGGFGVKSGVKAECCDQAFRMSVDYDFYRYYTWIGYDLNLDMNRVNPKILDVQGDNSVSSLHVLEIRADLRLCKHLYLTGAFRSYIRNTDYKYYDEVSSFTTDCCLMLTYVL